MRGCGRLWKVVRGCGRLLEVVGGCERLWEFEIMLQEANQKRQVT